MPILNKELSKHWGVTEAAVSALRKRKSMPPFESLAEADAWRAMNAPPRVRAGAASGGPPPPPIVDDTRGLPIDEAVVRQADLVVRSAFEAVLRAQNSSNYAGAALAQRNWSEAALRCEAVKTKFLGLQERSRQLVAVDRAKDIFGRHLQSLRLQLLRLGDRAAADANPANPAQAKRSIDAEVDRIFARLADALPHAAAELAAAPAVESSKPAALAPPTSPTTPAPAGGSAP